MAIVAIALGSNLGDKAGYLRAALRRLGEGARVVAVSGFYDTAPVGYLDQDRFLNAAALVETEETPQAFLARLLAVERELGRVREIPNGPRTIDLDILLWEQEIVDEPGLTIPHPRLHERAFVLEPLNEIAPEFRHPVLGQTVRALWAQVRSASA